MVLTEKGPQIYIALKSNITFKASKFFAVVVTKGIVKLDIEVYIYLKRPFTSQLKMKNHIIKVKARIF